MPQPINGKILLKENILDNTFRMIIAGSSGSGKTYFAEQLFLHAKLKQGTITEIFYYHPVYMKKTPVAWHETIKIPITYKVGLPDKETILKMKPNTCIVVDDAFDKVLKSEVMDHLIRVMSGKMQLSVVIMSQNYFSKGVYARDIRNSCNYIVLFRNCSDANLNKRICQMLGLTKAYAAAERDNQEMSHPYLFLDQSQHSQMTNFRLYTDIYSRYKIVYSTNGMKHYIISEADFKVYYDITENKRDFQAVLNENEKSKTNKQQHSEHTVNNSRGNSNTVVSNIANRKHKWKTNYRRRFRESIQKHRLNT